MKQSRFPDSDYVLKNACLSKVNLDEESAAKLSTWVEKPTDFLLYLGSPGCGKTYFCASMINLFKEKRFHYLFNFERDFLACLRNQVDQGFDPIFEIEKICEIPFVIIDDMGSARADNLTDWQRDMLFTFVDIRAMSRLPTIITSNHYLKDIKNNFEQRFYSRLAAKRNTILELKADDLRQTY